MSFSSHRTRMCLVLWIETKEVGKKPSQMGMSPRISVQAAQHTLSFVTSYSTSCGCDTESLPLPPVAVLWLHHPFLCSSKLFRSSRPPTSFHLEALPSVPWIAGSFLVLFQVSGLMSLCQGWWEVLHNLANTCNCRALILHIWCARVSQFQGIFPSYNIYSMAIWASSSRSTSS